MTLRGYFQALAICLCVSFALAGCSADSDDAPTARYFGLTPPGLKAEIFAPGIVSAKGSRDRDICYSEDFRELYFTRDSRIMIMRREKDQWSEPEPAPFGSEFGEFETFLSPDNKRAYYISRRPLNGGEQPEEFQMWKVDRANDGWGVPERINDLGDYYPSLTSSGTMYFTDSCRNICRAELVDGRMSGREKLGDSVNTEDDEYNAFIAPDESYLIFTSTGWGDGFGSADMYISYRSKDDHWTKPRNMGVAVNSSGLEYCPSLSPDGKYLFFARRGMNGENIYWIDAGIIDTLRNTDMDVSLGLYHAVAADGSGEIARHYDRVREENAAYRDFDGDLLCGLADRLLAGERTEEAISVLKFCFELHPKSGNDIRRLKLAAVENNEKAFDETADRLRQVTPDRTENENILNRLGYELIGYAKLEAAVQVLKLNTELFSESGNVYDSYAEVLALQGDTARSIENYRKSLERDPENANARMMLNRLGSE